MVLSQNTKRDSGKKVQMENINAGKTIGDVVRTCLGPKAMLKMLMDPMGGIVMTNDGNAILREITVQHPAAKTMIEIARTQDEEVGDGTTSVIVLASEVLGVSQQFEEDIKLKPSIPREEGSVPFIFVGKAFKMIIRVRLNIVTRTYFLCLLVFSGVQGLSFSQNPNQKLQRFLPYPLINFQGKNPGNFWLAFWEKR